MMKVANRFEQHPDTPHRMPARTISFITAKTVRDATMHFRKSGSCVLVSVTIPVKLDNHHYALLRSYSRSLAASDVCR